MLAYHIVAYKKPEHALNACLVLTFFLVANARSGGGFPSARITTAIEAVPLGNGRVKCCATADGPGAPMS